MSLFDQLDKLEPSVEALDKLKALRNKLMTEATSSLTEIEPRPIQFVLVAPRKAA